MESQPEGTEGPCSAAVKAGDGAEEICSQKPGGEVRLQSWNGGKPFSAPPDLSFPLCQ